MSRRLGDFFSTVSFVNMYLSDCITFVMGGQFLGHVLTVWVSILERAGVTKGGVFSRRRFKNGLSRGRLVRMVPIRDNPLLFIQPGKLLSLINFHTPP